MKLMEFCRAVDRFALKCLTVILIALLCALVFALICVNPLAWIAIALLFMADSRQ